mmetsp:Transcript_32166/g.70406  ORF Transcript_32166/g.70406 Transcript_32166/m.70406 type:complete len:129 (+) Transcript_32166:58-444(+)
MSRAQVMEVVKEVLLYSEHELSLKGETQVCIGESFQSTVVPPGFTSLEILSDSGSLDREFRLDSDPTEDCNEDRSGDCSDDDDDINECEGRIFFFDEELETDASELSGRADVVLPVNLKLIDYFYIPS